MPSTLQVDFVDETGEKAVQKFHASTILDPADQAGFVTVLDAITDAAIIGMKVIAQDFTAVGTAIDGPYATDEDKAVFYFRGPGGGKYQIAIPAPDEAIFLTDKETVNPANAAVVAFLAQVAASIRDPNGGLLTFITGRRTKTYTKKG